VIAVTTRAGHTPLAILEMTTSATQGMVLLPGVLLQHNYYDDPLWDGEGCGPISTCCRFNNPPWFSKSLPKPTTDDLEVRNIRISRGGYGYDALIELIEV
jgi:hypothetical protein